MRLIRLVRGWFAGLVGDDPAPGYSRLDAADGLTRQCDGGHYTP
jgi:hypothetical protein